MIAQQGTIIVSLDHGGDMTQYLESLKSLLRDDYEFMLPAHGLAIEQPHKKVQQYIDHRLQREAKIKRVIEEGARDWRDLVARAYDDAPEAVWPLAEKSLAAHLVRLGRTDWLERRPGKG
jgi:glyoxylase-like metal-dependent hydrolase (beta-lactamase superfamily II)